jgi:hypothetical protein
VGRRRRARLLNSISYVFFQFQVVEEGKWGTAELSILEFTSGRTGVTACDKRLWWGGCTVLGEFGRRRGKRASMMSVERYLAVSR